MKYSSVFFILLIVLSVLLFNGFQCGSSEMTSAKLYMQQKNYERADTALQKEVAKNPKNSEAWFLLGRIHLEQGDIPGMVADFDKSMQGENAAEFAKDITDARKYAWQVSLNKGAAAYNRSAFLQKEGSAAKADSVQTYLKMATDAYHTAILASPDSAMTYVNLAIAEYAGGNYDDEIATLKDGKTKSKAADLDTMLIDAYRAKINAINEKIIKTEAKNKQDAAPMYTEALKTIDEARQLYPDNTDLMAIQTDFYVRSGRADEAKPAIRAAIQKDPANKVNYYNLGVLLLQTDSLQGAIDQFEQALQIDKDYDLALQNAAVSYMKLGDKVRKANQESGSKKEIDKSYVNHFKKAAGYFERLTELKKDDPNYWDYLASAYANAGMVKKAEEAIKKADALRKK